MPPKRKADDEVSIAEVCSCGKDHQPNAACDLAKQQSLQNKSHIDLTQKIIPSSPMATIIVGPEKKEMQVYKALLTLHSGFFRTYFREVATRSNLENQIEGAGTIFVSEDDAPSSDAISISLPNINVSQFSIFVGWLFTNMISLSLCMLSRSMDDQPEGLWQVGHILQCKDFQNSCLDLLRNKIVAYNKRPSKWPNVATANYIYRVTEPGSTLRIFMADCLVKNNIFASEEESVVKQWKILLENCQNFSLDYIIATGRKMKGKPWFAENRDLYAQQDVPLDERWRDQILTDQSEAQVEQKANGREGDWLSKVEYAHLRKVQKNTRTAAHREAEQATG